MIMLWIWCLFSVFIRYNLGYSKIRCVHNFSFLLFFALISLRYAGFEHLFTHYFSSLPKIKIKTNFYHEIDHLHP